MAEQEDAPRDGRSNASKFDIQQKYLDFFGRLAWPATAGILLFLFYSPIYGFVERMSAQDAQRVSIGSFNVEFNGSEAARMPELDATIAAKLASLDNDERETLLAIGELYPLENMCTLTGFEAAIRRANRETADFVAARLDELEARRRLLGSLDSLEAMNLVRSQRVPIASTDKFCEGSYGRSYSLTDEGKQARRYYLDLTSRTINFATAEEGD
ncbi:hypothetical protein [Parerythrobacter aestuarii]|uniref:hypothetical protein n=1 Tax=Parerythrobacter aestuarii TaxID=3020909 RepID=UPI0024DE5C7C|nr:hypothetical protein [Parerythrobacter aestuarii]